MSEQEKFTEDFTPYYRVIEIIDSTQLIINCGTSNGAKAGDRVIIGTKGKPVIDPETNESLGTLDLIKDVLEIWIPYKNFSICRKVLRTKEDPFRSPLYNLQKRIRNQQLYLSALGIFESQEDVKYLEFLAEKKDFSKREFILPNKYILVGDTAFLEKDTE